MLARKTIPCVRVKSVDGTIRLVPMQTWFKKQPGDTYDGVDETCGGTQEPRSIERNQTVDAYKELDAELGKDGVGDWIKTVARPIAILTGKTNCSSCEVRRILTNAYTQLRKKHGTIEALKIMKNLWALSFEGKYQEALDQLKAHLDA